MALARMIVTDEDALICDLAETYHIYDYRRLPVISVAVFSLGLRQNSRIKMIISGNRITLEESLLACAVDRLSILAWQKTKDGSKGTNVPQSILEKLLGIDERKSESDTQTFSSGEEFLRERNRLLGKEET